MPNSECGMRNCNGSSSRAATLKLKFRISHFALHICSSRQRFSQVLQQPVEHLVRTTSAIELAEQPCPPRRGHPDTLHRDLGGAALEVELEEGFRAAAVDDLDPCVGGGGFVLDDFDDGVGFAALALAVQPVAVALALTG